MQVVEDVIRGSDKDGRKDNRGIFITETENHM